MGRDRLFSRHDGRHAAQRMAGPPFRCAGGPDRYPARLLAFTAAAFAGAAAPSLDVVILSRVVQGACGGLLQPLSMQILFRVFPPERRGTAMGLFGLGVVLAPAFGPALGGLAIDGFDWRWVFLLPLPGVAAALPLGLVFMPEREASGPRPAFDWPGFLLLVLAIVALLDGLASGQRIGWSSDRIVFELALGAAATAGFIFRQLTARSPLLDTGSLRALRPDQLQQGSGPVNFTRMLGGACGINLLVVLLEMRTGVFAEAFTATQTAANAASKAMLEGVGRLAAAGGLGPEEASAAAARYLGEVMLAQAQAFQDVFVAVGLLAFAALLPAFVMARTGLQEPAASARLQSA